MQNFIRISITTYLKKHFAEGDRSRPTVINDIRKGRLRGELLNGKWYIFVDDNYNPVQSVADSRSNILTQSTGNSIADAILARTRKVA